MKLPVATSPEAVAALEEMNIKYNYPTSPANCARLGWMAAYNYLLKNESKTLQELQDKISSLQKQIDDNSWVTNPDRMGGAFTQQEIADAQTWR